MAQIEVQLRNQVLRNAQNVKPLRLHRVGYAMRMFRKYFFTMNTVAASLLIAGAFFLQGYLSYLNQLHYGEEIIHIINKIDQIGFLLLLGLALLMVICALGFHQIERSKSLVTVFLIVFVLTVVAKGKFDNMGSDSMAEIIHANSQEGGDFIESYLSFVKLSVKECAILFGPLLLIPVYALVVRESEGAGGMADIRLALKIIAFVYFLTIAHFFYQMVVNFHSIDYFRERLESSTANAIGALARTREAPNVVVYIGESTSRENFPLYMPTYPQADPLQQIRDDLIVFSDVVTPFSHTFPSLYRAFTLSQDPYLDQFLLIKDLQRPNGLAILEKGGMETHWISNQNLVGRWDWNSELFGRHSKHLKVLNGAERTNFNGVRKTDRALVAAYMEEASHLQRSRQMIFLHSYAGHADYCKNIPREEQTVSGRFLPALPQHALFGDMYVGNFNERMESINCYGSVMSFISKNLRAVIDDLARRPVPVVFLYFADHGEEIYEGTGHDSRRNSHRHIEIPFFIYFNPAAREAYPDLYRAAQANRTKPYSIEWLADTLVDLAGIDYKNRQLLSVFRPDLQVPKRYSLRRTDIRGNQFILAVDDEDASQHHALLNQGHDYFRKRRLYNAFPAPEKHKLCSYRTNSLLKFREAASIFKCVEIDITIDAEAAKLYVYRPPQANNHLQLKDLISLDLPMEGRMLLAIRNPDRRNLAVLHTQLDRLFVPNQRHRVVVEIPHFDGVDKLELQRLAKAGYKLVYALPADLGVGCSRATGQAVCQRFEQDILPVIEQAGVQGIAFDIEALPFVRTLHAANRLQYNIKDFSAGAGKTIDHAMLARSNTYSVPYRSTFDY